jgi:hypothetical protein
VTIVPRRNRNATKGGNAHNAQHRKTTTKRMGEHNLTPFNTHARKRRNDAWATATR